MCGRGNEDNAFENEDHDKGDENEERLLSIQFSSGNT
jgi:hypothetical protein